MTSMSAEQIAALVSQTVAAAMAANAPEVDEVTAKVLDNAPGKRSSAKAATTAKAATLHRKLDTIAVEAGETVRFVVTPCYGAGDKQGLRTAGAAVDMFETDANGKENKRRSPTRGIVAALCEDPSILKQLAAAIDKVDKAAKIGPHAPAKVAAQ